MKYLKNFESMFAASEFEFTVKRDLYLCSNCHFVFQLYKPRMMRCVKCQSKDVNLINKDNIEEHEDYQ